MYELIKAIGNSYYIESPAKIGLIDSGEGVAYLIDSGSDRSAGKKAKQVIEEYEPAFASPKELFAYMEKMTMDCQGVTYEEDGSITLA